MRTTDNAHADPLGSPVYCMRCGRKLTHPTSQAAGIGPECSEIVGICQQALADYNCEHLFTPQQVAALRDDGLLVISYAKRTNRNIPGLIVRIHAPGDEFKKLLAAVKDIPGRWYDPQIRAWYLPATKEVAEAAINLPQARVFKDHLPQIKDLLEGKVKGPIEARANSDELVAGLKGGLIVMSWQCAEKSKWYQIKDEIKTIPGRRFVKSKRWWTAPVSLDAIATLKKLGFRLKPALQRTIESLQPKDVKLKEIPGLQGELLPFQHAGVEWIESRNGRALIADEMGLGKTVQALAWLQVNPSERRPALAVCPASLKLNWEREANRWLTPAHTIVISGRYPGANMEKGRAAAAMAKHMRFGQDYPANSPGSLPLYIINYDILASWLPALQSIGLKTVIFDESHYCKNEKAQRSLASMRLAALVDNVICLSGTPVVNRPKEFFTTLKMVRPELFPSFWDYAHKYCGAHNNGWGWDFSGATNTEELHQKLTETIMIRRLKRDVLKDLPSKVRSVVPLEISNRAEYDQAAEDFIAYLSGQEDGAKKAAKAAQAETLTRLSALRRLTSQGKYKAALLWISDFLESSNEKLIVFCWHRDMADKLYEAFAGSCVKVTGSENNDARQAAVDRFQEDPDCRLFIGNIKAAGVGLTLTAASNVAFLELPWTPGDLTQAEDRAHRIGQDQTVNIYYLLAEGTIEEDMAEVLDYKRAVLAEVLDGDFTVAEDEQTMLTMLLDRVRNQGGKG